MKRPSQFTGKSLQLFPVFVLYIFLFFHQNSFFIHCPEKPPVVSNNHYKGILIDDQSGRQQKREASCGHAALAYLLTLQGIPSSEDDIIKNIGKTEWMNLKDMADYIALNNLHYQALEVTPSWFRKHQAPCVMHVEWGHFITFIDFNHRGDCLIFDPMRGLILLDWKTLKEIWDRYIFYVYT